MKRAIARLLALVLLLGLMSVNCVPAQASDWDGSASSPADETVPSQAENPERNTPDSDATVNAVTSGVWTYTLSEGDALLTAYNGTATNITVPSTIDGLDVVGIGSSIFSGRYDIVSVSLPSTLETIGSYAFKGCKALKSITLPRDLEKVGYQAFYNCESLSNITVVSVNLGNFDSSGNTFYNAGKETDGITVVFGSGVTRIPAYMFKCDEGGYARVKSVSINSDVTGIGTYAFYNCYDLATVSIPSNSLMESIGSHAFRGCNSLISITLPKDLETVGYQAFYNCESLSGITVNSVNLGNFDSSGNTFYNAGKESGGITVTFGSGVTRIPAYMFKCDGGAYARVKSVSISSSATVIGTYAFYNCCEMTTVSIPSNSQLETIASHAFQSCTALESITLPKELETVGYQAFYNCESLSKIAVNATKLEDFDSTGNTFYNAGKETDGITVTFGSGVTRIPAYMFDCDGGAYARVKSVSIGSSATVIGTYAFYNCYDLTTVSIPSVSTLKTIGDYAFKNCTALKSIALPKNLETIGYQAFYSCEALTSITLGQKLKTLESYAFAYCENLTRVRFWGSAPSIGSYAFDDVTAKVYYPSGDTTWTSSMRQDYGGTLTWTAQKLSAPTVKVSNIASSGKIKLTWNAVDGATKYKIYRSTSKNGTYSLLTTVQGTKLTNTSAVAGKQYYYYVIAVNDHGAASAKSEIVTRVCDLPCPEITLSNVASSGKIKISWKAVSGAVKYEVYRSKDNKTWTLLKTVSGTSLTNTSTTAGTLYYYKVKAIASNSSANSAYSEVKSRTCDLARPTLTVKLNSNDKPYLTWTQVTGAVKYEVYRSTDGKTWTLLKTVSGTKLTHSSAAAGTTYYYKVRAIASTSSANSAYSTVKSVTAG